MVSVGPVGLLLPVGLVTSGTDMTLTAAEALSSNKPNQTVTCRTNGEVQGRIGVTSGPTFSMLTSFQTFTVFIVFNPIDFYNIYERTFRMYGELMNVKLTVPPGY